jgi:hypothetical protein
MEGNDIMYKKKWRGQNERVCFTKARLFAIKTWMAKDWGKRRMERLRPTQAFPVEALQQTVALTGMDGTH